MSLFRLPHRDGATGFSVSAGVLSALFAPLVFADGVFHFPPEFQFCTATAAHQVEGNNRDSDWWQFEQKPGVVKNGDQSGPAAAHWEKLEEDVGWMKAMHLNQYRFSVEWAKIEPKAGQFDREALRHYSKKIKLLRAAGIEPMVTLHHFTFPHWVARLGGWEWPGIAEAFENYTRIVYGELGGSVTQWVTVNEPMPHLMGGYVVGLVPPEIKAEPRRILSPLRGMLRAHAAAYHALHELARTQGKKISVGMAHHLRTLDPRGVLNPMDAILAAISNDVWNWMVPDAIQTGRLRIAALWFMSEDLEIPRLKGTQDYFGLNYYSGDLVYFDLFRGFQKQSRGNLPLNDMGWDIYPEGFFRVMTAVHERYPQLSIAITENGIADAKDEKRPQFIYDHLAEVAKAIRSGIPVTGYCHWSLMDNFEWDSGYDPRFGLIAVDYKTQKRTARPSARYFSEIARTRTLLTPSEVLAPIRGLASEGPRVWLEPYRFNAP